MKSSPSLSRTAWECKYYFNHFERFTYFKFRLCRRYMTLQNARIIGLNFVDSYAIFDNGIEICWIINSD